MKFKYADFPNWSRVNKKSYINKYFNNDEFSGNISLLTAEEVKEKLFINKHNENDFIICVSSGVNLSAFIYYFTKQRPSNDNPWIQALTISPVLFSTNNKVF